ncbi:MAG: hypothetical protein FWG66_04025 [Spirochaetes bacterium]|nr:hypothetical protein [Spirochaetota bacterium]
MSLGFSMRFNIGRIGRTKKAHYEQFFKNLPPPVPEWEPLCRFNETDFSVRLAPFTEAILGEWTNGELHISAKTNGAGPGYHAYLIELMDTIDMQPSRVDDQTGYYKTRDFAELQNHMEAWLHATSHTVVNIMEQSEEVENLTVSFPSNWMPVFSGDKVACPLGYFEKSFFESAKAGDLVGHAFFIWWNKEQDALFFRNAAFSLMLCEINWLEAFTDLEAQMIGSALESLEKAYALDPGLDYPVAEWLELAQLARPAEQAEPSDDDAGDDLVQTIKSRFTNIGKPAWGYKRGMITSYINGWGFNHNGKMHLDVTEDGSVAFWQEGRGMRITCANAGLEGGIKRSKEEIMAGITKTQEGTLVPFPLKNPDIISTILHKEEVAEGGEKIFSTMHMAIYNSEILLLSFYYKDKADRKWATDISATLVRTDSG